MNGFGKQLAASAYSRSKSGSKAARGRAARKSGHTPKSAKPNAHAPLGQGGRFAALKQKLAKRPGVTNPGGLAAYIGRKTYGASKMASMAAAGRK